VLYEFIYKYNFVIHIFFLAIIHYVESQSYQRTNNEMEICEKGIRVDRIDITEDFSKK
jgi:hypothetical protein